MIKVKALRQALGVTQKELAEASDVDLRWIQKLESGEINIENITVLKFSKLLNGFSRLADSDFFENDEYLVLKGANENVKKIIM